MRTKREDQRKEKETRLSNESRGGSARSTYLRIHRLINPRHQQRDCNARECQKTNSPPDQGGPPVSSFSSMKGDVERLSVEGQERPQVSVGVEGESEEEE